MKNKLHTDLSNMPYQHLRLNSTQELFVWIPDPKKSLWVPVNINKNETVEQSLVWWSNRGFCTARIHMCETCGERWARHKRVRVDSLGEWKDFYCDGCVPPLNVELPHEVVPIIDVSQISLEPTHHVEHIFAEEAKVEPQHMKPANPRGLWDSFFHPNAKIKERH